jgi:hypothetical protein
LIIESLSATEGATNAAMHYLPLNATIALPLPGGEGWGEGERIFPTPFPALLRYLHCALLTSVLKRTSCS